VSAIRSGDRVLFQGDSITDCGRRNEGADPLGGGYVAQIVGQLAVRRPELAVEFVNRGVSGDRTPELLARWQRDCLDLKPQVLSIKIGVNDVWRKRRTADGQGHVPLDEFQGNLRNLCDQARAGGVRTLVLVSPTTIDADPASDLNILLGTYAEWVRSYAADTKAIFVDARTPLLRARASQPTVRWTPDGCHPATSGHAVLATAWCDAVLSHG